MKYPHIKVKGAIVLLAILSLAFSPGDSCGQSRKIDKIQKILNKAITGHLVGVAVYIKMGDGNASIVVSGFRDQENGKPMEVGTNF